MTIAESYPFPCPAVQRISIPVSCVSASWAKYFWLLTIVAPAISNRLLTRRAA
ncbi:hypothetical protein [Microbispora sp. ATCC PTA-5024]|uniref:hypothetical protein n=1 Tax=Microbispora sp. ATCC PTA-5024 TaxID=316330 RepID=UPI00041C4ED1|nr:hypothetical protein [Microbispora sp. ATCC PTA-5024]